ncbi:MAG TPA: hypothetical protein VJ925_07165 [Longimicrobiales bacterium]|nr:hypothetical protein [Longimicrobiales bacterium]
MRRSLRFLSIPLLLLAAATITPVAASAQALHYTSVSTFEMGGTLGALMSAFSDMDEPSVEEVWVGDGAMRMDADGGSTILHMTEGRMIQVDHDARTWYAMDLGNMTAMADRARQDAEEAMRSRDEAAAEQDDAPEFEGEFDVERTGRTETVSGYDAEQVLLTLTMEARGEQADEQGESPLAGRMVLLSEMWISAELSDHPAFAELGEAAMEFAPASFEGGDDMGPLAADPRMAEALERMQEEMGDLGGMAVRTTSLFMLLPGDMEFDRQAAIDALDQELDQGPGLTGAAGAGAMDAARSALGGLFGGGDDEPEEPELVQQSLMRVVQEIRDVESVTLEPGFLDPPADYREIESPMSRIGGN